MYYIGLNPEPAHTHTHFFSPNQMGISKLKEMQFFHTLVNINTVEPQIMIMIIIMQFSFISEIRKNNYQI